MTTVLCVGHAVQDFVFTLPTLPRTAEKHQASRFTSVGGGPAATAAVAIARLGGRVLLAARVGNDAIADTIVGELEGHGVDCGAVKRFPGCSSSLSAVMVDAGGERMIVNYLDPALPDAADWLPSPRLAGAAAVLADCRWPAGAASALAAARAAGIPAVLDADKPIPRDRAALAAATHVAFSAEALAEYSGETDPVEGLRSAAADLPGWCCVTAGAAGVYVLERGQLTRYPGHQVAVVDTLGAGDVWHGAFALGLAEGMAEPAAVRFASAAAALKVQRLGGRSGAPMRDEVDELLKQTAAKAAKAPE
jgi:sulfofructose kinase